MLVGATVPADPDVAHVVDCQPVVRRGPIVLARLAGPSEGGDQIAFLVELQDGRTWLATLTDALGEANLLSHELIFRVPMNDPDVIPCVHRNTDHRSHQPVVRERLGK